MNLFFKFSSIIKASLGLKIILMVFFTMALQESIFKWCRDHRLHHKYSDTESDPHNGSRGFFFSHMGWLMVKKNKTLLEKGKLIYLNDLLNDPVVAFNHKYYMLLALLFWAIIPISVPVLLWQESLWVAMTMNVLR